MKGFTYSAHEKEKKQPKTQGDETAPSRRWPGQTCRFRCEARVPSRPRRLPPCSCLSPHPVLRPKATPSSPRFGREVSRDTDVKCTQYLHFHVSVFLICFIQQNPIFVFFSRYKMSYTVSIRKFYVTVSTPSLAEHS